MLSDKVVIKHGNLEIVLGDDVDNSVLIRDIGIVTERSQSLRIISKYSRFNGGISKTALYPQEVFEDVVEYEISGFDPDTRDKSTNDIYLGKSGYFYQWGNIKGKIKERE